MTILNAEVAEVRKENQMSRQIIGCAIRVHTELGPGLLESAYQACLAYELREAGLRVECEVPLPLVYRAMRLDLGYRLDLLVENCVVVELKAIEAIAPVHKAQLLSHLRLSGKKLGLLINFHVARLKDGIYRVVNDL
jgi:GxxExxY protein